ncbi:MAG: SMP-30/gluconolactonase/LRE family protein [Tunicatimonas sp.]
MRLNQQLLISCLLLHSVVGNAQSLENESEIVAPGASLQQVAADYKFTEGPAADAQGNVFFTDQPNNRIMKWATDGTVSVFMEDAGRANGLFFDRQGNLIACADEKNQLWQISPDKEVTVLVNDFKGKRLNGPNDLWVDPKGGIYFTDPYYQRDYWTHTEKEIDNEQVYYLAPNKKTLTPVATDLVKPNGIVGTADGKQLYVADIGDKKTYVYQVNDDGSLSDKQLFTDMGSDGLTLDNEGNVYLTGQGVTVFDKQGKQIEHIEVDEGWTANVCFGGRDRKTLFITAMKSLYTLEMRVKGVQ